MFFFTDDSWRTNNYDKVRENSCSWTDYDFNNSLSAIIGEIGDSEIRNNRGTGCEEKKYRKKYIIIRKKQKKETPDEQVERGKTACTIPQGKKIMFRFLE